MTEEKLYQLALQLVPGVGPRMARMLISHLGSASSIFKTPKGKLKKINGIGEKTAEALIQADFLKEAEKVLERCGKQDTEAIFFTDETYPERLKHIYDAPLIIFKKGVGTLDTAKAVAIVGTRSATDYGREVTREIIQSLIPYNPLIVSGLAYGIDIEAHRAALDNGLPTFGVMASGTDVIYPSVHKHTALKMLEKGGLVTEYAPGTKPEASFFPARNRIIAGLAEAVIVVEAASRGGALITAEIANSYDREVLAIPGNLGNSFSEGCNKLIEQQKAHIYTSAESLASLLNWDLASSTKKKTATKPPALSEMASKIWDSLEKQPNGIHLDTLSWNTQIPIHQLASELLNLEFEGFVKSLPGKQFKLIR
ncbi:MAG: DNA-processing protein DprA [Imperialibacter sp.]|uniref:DNA-processing protein DprA n=1 Tax=Imperialibacter sp. TaxID=2038411 RepID=UPI0032EE6634